MDFVYLLTYRVLVKIFDTNCASIVMGILIAAVLLLMHISKCSLLSMVSTLGNITRRDAVQQKAPFARIRLLDAVAAKQKARFAAVWREAGAYII